MACHKFKPLQQICSTAASTKGRKEFANARVLSSEDGLDEGGRKNARNKKYMHRARRKALEKHSIGGRHVRQATGAPRGYRNHNTHYTTTYAARVASG
jgi:hypothetical protein